MVRRLPRRLALVALVSGGLVSASVGAVSCSLATSLDGLSGGAPASTDASTSDDAAREAAAPGGPGDAGGTDGATLGRWCARQSPPSKVCEDLDGIALGTGWVTTTSMKGASVTVDTTTAQSPPASLLTRTDGTDSQRAKITLAVPATSVSKLRVAYDLRVETYGSYAEFGVISLQTPTGTQNHYLRMNGQQSGALFRSEVYLADGGVPGHEFALSGTPTLGSWTRVLISLDLQSNPHRLSVSLDGVERANQILEPDLFVPGTATVDVGIFYASMTPSPWTLRWDDITVDWD